MTCSSVLTQLSALAWSKQEDGCSLEFYTSTYPKSFEATAAGASTGTTIISSTLASYGSDDDDFVGALVEVAYCENGPAGEYASGIRRKVVAFDLTTATLTIEALPFQVVIGDSFNLLKVPNGSVVEDTGGSQTNIVDATRDEADDYWTGAAEKGGPYLVPIKTANMSSTAQKLILDFESSTGTFSTSSWGASSAVGDLFEVWEYPEPFSGVPLAFNRPRVDNTAIKGSRGMLRGVGGLYEGSGQVELAFRGPGSSRVGLAPELDTPLGVHCTATAIDDCTCTSGATTTVIPTSAGSPVANDIYITEAGDVFVAQSVDVSKNITVTPPVRTAPADNTTLYGMRRYVPSDVINYAMALKQWHGKNLVDTFYGCVPNIVFSATRGDYLKAALSFQCADGYRVHKDHTNTLISRPYRPITPTVIPRAISDARAVLYNRTVSSEITLRGFTIDLGIDIQPHANMNAPNAIDGFEGRNDTPIITLDCWLGSDTMDEIQSFLMGEKMTLLVQAGKYVGDPGVFAFWAYEVEYTGAEIADDGGSFSVSLPMRVTVDTSETTLSRWMIGIC